MWSHKRFHTLSHFFREKFGSKVIKLALDGGFTCPNRDGTVGEGGCIFCSERGSGDFAGSRENSITKQLTNQISLVAPKWPKASYLAYFQNFSGTYAPVSVLRSLHEEALAFPGVMGIAIATRPDALPPPMIDYLRELNGRTFVWVELGLQTIHPASATFFRRGYDLRCFETAVNSLHRAGIHTVVHTIAGIPGETPDDLFETMQYCGDMGIWGIKIHSLYILEGTDLGEYYTATPFPLLSRDGYIDLVARCLERLPPEMVIHRITGDGPRDSLLAPQWPRDKRSVLNGLDRLLSQRNTYQGRLHGTP
ncbi:TIGR01212 family radical SAM protein [Myxococcota bacterium]|nr:TIGR01212 family radical SAM protein [Myxococcota bacterium]